MRKSDQTQDDALRQMLSRTVRSPDLRDWPGLLLRVLLFPIGAAVTFAAFFLPSIPFALALLPLFAGLWSGARTVCFTTMTSFMIWPVFLSAWGLHGVGVSETLVVWTLATGLVTALGLLAAQIGILPATLLLAFIPVFPASPLLPLAALLPGLDPASLFGVLTALALTEATRRPRRRRTLLGLTTCCLGIWAMGHGLIREHNAQHLRIDWRETPEPTAITERGRWIALREQLPEGTVAILGENLFNAKNDEARAFWCHAVTTRNLTLYLGVAEPYGAVARSAVWKLDAETCAKPPVLRKTPAIHRAGLGIPYLTGTWGPMRNTPVPASGAGEEADWLICLEAFLPWAWAGLLMDTSQDHTAPRPVIVLSNDGAFRPLPYLPPMPALGHPPVHELRRKAATAMARLTGRPVYFAETGRTLLLNPALKRTPP